MAELIFPDGSSQIISGDELFTLNPVEQFGANARILHAGSRKQIPVDSDGFVAEDLEEGEQYKLVCPGWKKPIAQPKPAAIAPNRHHEEDEGSDEHEEHRMQQRSETPKIAGNNSSRKQRPEQRIEVDEEDIVDEEEEEEEAEAEEEEQRQQEQDQSQQVRRRQQQPQQQPPHPALYEQNEVSSSKKSKRPSAPIAEMKEGQPAAKDRLYHTLGWISVVIITIMAMFFLVAFGAPWFTTSFSFTYSFSRLPTASDVGCAVHGSGNPATSLFVFPSNKQWWHTVNVYPTNPSTLSMLPKPMACMGTASLLINELMLFAERTAAGPYPLIYARACLAITVLCFATFVPFVYYSSMALFRTTKDGKHYYYLTRAFWWNLPVWFFLFIIIIVGGTWSVGVASQVLRQSGQSCVDLIAPLAPMGMTSSSCEKLNGYVSLDASRFSFNSYGTNTTIPSGVSDLVVEWGGGGAWAVIFVNFWLSVCLAPIFLIMKRRIKLNPAATATLRDPDASESNGQSEEEQSSSSCGDCLTSPTSCATYCTLPTCSTPAWFSNLFSSCPSFFSRCRSAPPQQQQAPPSSSLRTPSRTPGSPSNGSRSANGASSPTGRSKKNGKSSSRTPSSPSYSSAV